MRTIAQGVTTAFVSANLRPGGRRVAWRQLPFIARFRNDAAGACAFTILNGITNETIDFNLISGNSGISSSMFLSPGVYRIEIGSVSDPIDVSIWVDGDTA